MSKISYMELIERCDFAEGRLQHMIELYKSMLNALNKDDISERISKSEDKANMSYFLKLSGNFAILAQSQHTIKDMVYVHAWSIYETWMKETIKGWFLLEPERLETKLKMDAHKVLKTDDVHKLREDIIGTQLRERDWDGPIKLLSKAEEAFKFSAFRSDKCRAIEQPWLVRAKQLRNEVVHGVNQEENPELLRWIKTGVHNDFIIRCIYRQIFVIQQVRKELKNRDRLLKEKIAAEEKSAARNKTEDIYTNLPSIDWKSVWGQSTPEK